MKDLTIQDLENFTKDDFASIKSISAVLYDEKALPNVKVDSSNCVKYVYITYQDGFIERFATVPGELEKGTAAVSMFLGKFQSYKEPLVKGVNFEQLTVSSSNPDVQNRIAYLEKKYNEQKVEEEKEKDTVVAATVVPGKETSTAKKVAIGLGGVAVGAALVAGGMKLADHIEAKNNDKSTSTTVDNTDQNEVDLNLEGKDFIYYRDDKNIPDSLQKQAVLNDDDSMFKLLLKTNGTYETKDGQTISTGYTFRQMFYANMYFNSTYYSNEQLLSILGDYDFSGGALDENGNLKEGLANEIEDFTIATMAMAMDNPEKLETVISLIKDEEAKNKALEGLPLFVDYINAIKNDNNKEIKAAKKAYQKWIHDSFINDVYSDNLDERKYESMDISSHPSLQFLLNAEASIVSYMGHPLDKNMGEILVTGEDGVQSLTNTACQTLADRLSSFYEERDTLRIIDAQYDSQNATTMQMQEILNVVKKDRKFKDLNVDFDILESDYDRLTKYTCDVDQIIRIVSERLQKFNLEPTDKEQELYFGELMASIVNKDLEKQGVKPSNKTTTTKKATTTVITNQNGTPAEKQEQAIEQSSPEAVQNAQNAENEKEGILGSVVTPEEEKITEEKAQEEAEKVQQDDQQAYDNIFNIAYSHYSQNGPSSIPGDEASYINNNNYIGNTGNITIAMAYQQGKDAGIADYYAKHPENNTFGGEDKIDETVKDYVDPGSISTDPGNSKGQTIEDIINQFNSEDPNKDNTVPSAVNETPEKEPVVTPAPVEKPEVPTVEPSKEEVPSSTDLSKPDLDQVPTTNNVVGGVVSDSVTEGLQQNPDGTYGGEVIVNPSVEDFVQTSNEPVQSTVAVVQGSTNLVIPEVVATDSYVEPTVTPIGNGEYTVVSDIENTTGGLDQVWSDLAAYVDWDSISTDEYYSNTDDQSYTKTR
ncbi:MAG: hypothetical protein E7168_02300 [Firmicutes bacterium]|nr:hypothetical protein [Bacillota bacterium]